MPGNRNHYPEIVLREVCVAYEQGVPPVHIAKGVGCYHQQICRWAKQRGWKVKPFTLTPEAEIAMMRKGKVPGAHRRT